MLRLSIFIIPSPISPSQQVNTELVTAELCRGVETPETTSPTSSIVVKIAKHFQDVSLILKKML